MIFDARKTERLPTTVFDYCIVGAGAAALTLARKLAHAQMKVIILESGGPTQERFTQNLNRGEVSPGGHEETTSGRRRQFGGTTTVWGGRCAGFDPLDFAARPYLSVDSWPIGHSDLSKYYPEALSACAAGTSFEDWNAEAGDARHWPKSDELLRSIYAFSPPTNFFGQNIDFFSRSPQIEIWSHAHVRKIDWSKQSGKVESVTVSTRGRTDSIRAKTFVLAAGGLESVRLLLLSPGPIAGEAHLGRHYMSHLSHFFLLPQKAWLHGEFERNAQGIYFQRALGLSASLQRELELPNHRVFRHHSPWTLPGHGDGVLSAAHLIQSLITRNQSVFNENLKAHLKNICVQLPYAIFQGGKFFAARTGKRRLPSLLLPPRGGLQGYRVDIEQTPSPSNHLTLGQSRDSYGDPCIRIQWSCSPSEKEAIERIINGVTRRVAGPATPLKFAGPKDPAQVSGHHLGGTRMSQSSKSGVVDPNCRVHGVENLYVVGSSVFPTSSYANPTLTVLALALRLADHFSNH